MTKNEPEWMQDWQPGELAERLLLSGDDAALDWAKTEEQVQYVGQVYAWPIGRVEQILKNRQNWQKILTYTNNDRNILKK